MSDKLRVLILEDVPTDAELMEYELQDAGIAFSAKRVKTRDAYITALSTFLPDVILSDYSLPAFDGVTALKLKVERTPHTPFIFVTGALGEELAIDLLKQGATDYVLKSRLSRLPVAVNRALREVEERKERERAYRDLRESEERHRVTLQTAMDGFLRTDMQGRILEVNEIYCRMSGYSEQELVTMNVADIEAVHTTEMIAANIRSFAELGPRRFESLHCRKDGSLFDVEISGQCQPIAGGQVVVFVRDITDRKRAEEALRRSEAYQAEGQRLSHTGSWAWNPLTEQCFYWSEEMYRIYEIDPQQGLPTSEVFWSRIHPEDRENMRELLWKSAIEKTEYVHGHRIVLPDGKVKHIHAMGHPVLDKAGELVEYVGTIVDATDRKRAEQALRRSEAYLAEGQRLSHTGSFAFDVASNKYIYVSEECLRIFELDAQEDFPNREAVSRLIHPEDWDRVKGDFEKLLREKVDVSNEFRIVLPSGAAKHIQVIRHPVLNDAGDVFELLGTAIDITERKRAESEINNLKNYLSNIIDSMPSMLVGIDNTRTVTQWNHQAEVFTGIPAGEAVGKPIVHLLPDFAPWIMTMGTDVDEHRPSSMENLLIEKEGERRFYDLMLYPLLVDHVGGAVLRIEDVTERVRAQELIVQTEKMMSIGGLAAGMAHEINNPLGIITQAAQNIERRISLELPANRKASEELGLNLEGIRAYFDRRQISDAIASIRTASSRAAKIVAHMLQFSRRADTTMEPASLAQVVDEALELAASDYDLKKKYDFRSIDIIKDYQDTPQVSIVSVEIEQVILNLLKNAAQAMIATPPDRRPSITLRLRCEGRYAVIEVEDNGPGMTEDIRRRVFEPFFTTKEPRVGTGLGLSVSYMIVTQNHKGLMEVQSTPDRGTVFKVKLPMGGEQT
jgi:PAS domain S-box-containing protein